MKNSRFCSNMAKKPEIAKNIFIRQRNEEFTKIEQKMPVIIKNYQKPRF